MRLITGHVTPPLPLSAADHRSDVGLLERLCRLITPRSSSHNSTGLHASAEHVYIHSVYILLLTTVYIYLSAAIFHSLVPSAAGPLAR